MKTETVVSCRIKPYIQPFERELAIRELTQLAGGSFLPRARSDYEFAIRTAVPPRVLAGRLAYWERVQAGRGYLTTQALREATVTIARNGVPFAELGSVLPFKDDPPLPNRRCLRYGSHGIHEYRGKFFPQLVRALLNTVGIRPGSFVADTMCGSGTTVVEAVLLGCRGLGLDLNPLSVFISRSKCEILRVSPNSLTKTHNTVREKLGSRPARTTRLLPWLESFSEHDQRYLRAWFSCEVLYGLERVVESIRSVRNLAERNLLWVCLSNILRRVSWQKEDDLRVRRENKECVDPVEAFVEEMTRSVRMVLAFLLQNKSAALGYGVVLDGDARASETVLKEWEGRVDAVVTSPPYATALPYLDTDRLSLIYLKLLSRDQHRRRDQLMVGNREITDSTRREYWASYVALRDMLPNAIVQLVNHVNERNANAAVGFRRRNLPALLGKYFIDMATVFESLRSLLKRKAPAFVVIGNNHTYAGNERVEIPTAALLGKLAELHGFELVEAVPMEMLVSRDIFKKNASDSETILMLRKQD
jgi:site-specific DNA-methyltransferase (cytosine-N4-specific)